MLCRVEAKGRRGGVVYLSQEKERCKDKKEKRLKTVIRGVV